MQAIYKNEDEGDSGRGTDPINLVIYVERVYRYLKREYIGRFRGRRNRI